jgi:sugar/nucleoside kinase (ribokinase family)
MVREYLDERGIKPFVNLEEENGCCYCLVESNGERSFLSHHGAEYLFSKVWMKDIDFSKAGSVYVSGIDVEDRTGNEIVEFVYEHPELDLYFAPGPRIMHIEKERITKLLRRRDTKGKGPVLHLNKTEACTFSGKDSVEEAAVFLAEKIGNILIITLGEKGCYYYEPEASQGQYVAGFPVEALDTTGAGDAHCGAVIAGLKQGKPLPEVCEAANKIGAKVASGHGMFPK